MFIDMQDDKMIGDTKCKNPECGKIVDALHMDDEGYCYDCHDKILDELIIEESDETRFLSDESLRVKCMSLVSRKTFTRKKRRV